MNLLLLSSLSSRVSISAENKKNKRCFFVVGFWSGYLTSFRFIVGNEAGFYKPNVLKLHPPLCRITAHATVPGYHFQNFSFHAFDPNVA